MTKSIEILADSVRGVYIPKHFAASALLRLSGWKGVPDSDIRILLSGPNHDEYWQAWDDVLSNAYFFDVKGYKWELYQDGDLFAYCEELMTETDMINLFGA